MTTDYEVKQVGDQRDMLQQVKRHACNVRLRNAIGVPIRNKKGADRPH